MDKGALQPPIAMAITNIKPARTRRSRWILFIEKKSPPRSGDLIRSFTEL
jgi:hypothetical protein